MYNIILTSKTRFWIAFCRAVYSWASGFSASRTPCSCLAFSSALGRMPIFCNLRTRQIIMLASRWKKVSIIFQIHPIVLTVQLHWGIIKEGRMANEGYTSPQSLFFFCYIFLINTTFWFKIFSECSQGQRKVNSENRIDNISYSPRKFYRVL